MSIFYLSTRANTTLYIYFILKCKITFFFTNVKIEKTHINAIVIKMRQSVRSKPMLLTHNYKRILHAAFDKIHSLRNTKQHISHIKMPHRRKVEISENAKNTQRQRFFNHCHNKFAYTDTHIEYPKTSQYNTRHSHFYCIFAKNLVSPFQP